MQLANGRLMKEGPLWYQAGFVMLWTKPERSEATRLQPHR